MLQNTASAIEANGSKSTQDAKLPLPVTLPTRDQTALLIKKRRSIFVKDLSGEQVERYEHVRFTMSCPKTLIDGLVFDCVTVPHCS